MLIRNGFLSMPKKRLYLFALILIVSLLFYFLGRKQAEEQEIKISAQKIEEENSVTVKKVLQLPAVILGRQLCLASSVPMPSTLHFPGRAPWHRPALSFTGRPSRALPIIPLWGGVFNPFPLFPPKKASGPRQPVVQKGHFRTKMCRFP